MMLDPRRVARALGGEVSGRDAISCPGPGHSPKERSPSVKLDPTAPDGFPVHSHEPRRRTAAIGAAKHRHHPRRELPRRDVTRDRGQRSSFAP